MPARRGWRREILSLRARSSRSGGVRRSPGWTSPLEMRERNVLDDLHGELAVVGYVFIGDSFFAPNGVPLLEFRKEYHEVAGLAKLKRRG